MKILVLSFYYPPDLSAGSFRTHALVRALREELPAGGRIEVLTTLPNRYKSFSKDAAELEVQDDGIEIRRFALTPHVSDMRGQSRAFLSFAQQVLRFVADRNYDLVFATSSRLMTASLGAWVSQRKHAPLYLDIRDIFVDTISDLLPGPAGWSLGHLFSRLEAWTMRRARRINLVSGGFADYFRSRYPGSSLAYFTNGIDPEFLNLALPPRQPTIDQRVVILYAGNVGAGQALHEIIPGLAYALREQARFVIIGDGGRCGELQSAIAHLDNVELRAPVSRADLIAAYATADVLFLHLGNYSAFEKVLPSKLFEYAAIGKPLLAGVAGYAAHFVQKEIANSAVFAPCDVAGGVASFQSLRIADQPRPEFVAKYARENIARAMAMDILRVD